MKRYRVEIEVVVEAYSEEQARDIASSITYRAVYHENVREIGRAHV